MAKSHNKPLQVAVMAALIALVSTQGSLAAIHAVKGRRADAKPGGANPTMVRILRSTNEPLSQESMEENELGDMMDDYASAAEDIRQMSPLTERILQQQQSPANIEPSLAYWGKPKRGNLFLRSSRSVQQEHSGSPNCICKPSPESNYYEATHPTMYATSGHYLTAGKRFDGNENAPIGGDPLFLRTFKRGVFFRTS